MPIDKTNNLPQIVRNPSSEETRSKRHSIKREDTLLPLLRDAIKSQEKAAEVDPAKNNLPESSEDSGPTEETSYGQTASGLLEKALRRQTTPSRGVTPFHGRRRAYRLRSQAPRGTTQTLSSHGRRTPPTISNQKEGSTFLPTPPQENRLASKSPPSFRRASRVRPKSQHAISRSSITEIGRPLTCVSESRKGPDVIKTAIQNASVIAQAKMLWKDEYQEGMRKTSDVNFNLFIDSMKQFHPELSEDQIIADLELGFELMFALQKDNTEEVDALLKVHSTKKLVPTLLNTLSALAFDESKGAFTRGVVCLFKDEKNPFGKKIYEFLEKCSEYTRVSSHFPQYPVIRRLIDQRQHAIDVPKHSLFAPDADTTLFADIPKKPMWFFKCETEPFSVKKPIRAIRHMKNWASHNSHTGGATFKHGLATRRETDGRKWLTSLLREVVEKDPDLLSPKETEAIQKKTLKIFEIKRHLETLKLKLVEKMTEEWGKRFLSAKTGEEQESVITAVELEAKKKLHPIFALEKKIKKAAPRDEAEGMEVILKDKDIQRGLQSWERQRGYPFKYSSNV